MSVLEHRIPPPLVALICGAGMWWLAQQTVVLDVSKAARLVAAALLAGAGFAVVVAGVVSFARARTTINPLQPDAASSLVTSGVFRYTRNPMYLGMLLVLTGWTAFLAAPAALVGVIAFWAYIGRFQIRPEEQAMAKLFGATYAEYAAKVRRWL